MTKLLLTPHDLSDDETIYHKYRLRDNIDLQKALESTYPSIKFDWVTDIQMLHLEVHNAVDGVRSLLPGTTPTFLYLSSGFELLSYAQQKQEVMDYIFRYFKRLVDGDARNLTIYFRYFQIFPPIEDSHIPAAYIKLKYEGVYSV